MYAAILVGVIIVAMSIFFIYSSDQAKMRGEAFGKALEFIQDKAVSTGCKYNDP